MGGLPSGWREQHVQKPHGEIAAWLRSPRKPRERWGEVPGEPQEPLHAQALPQSPPRGPALLRLPTVT